MPPVTTTKTNTGRKKGMVICQKTRTVLAPSMRAASFRSSGTFCKPAKKKSELKPTHVHKPRMISDGITRFASRSQAGPSMPNCAKAEFIQPKFWS